MKSKPGFGKALFRIILTGAGYALAITAYGVIIRTCELTAVNSQRKSALPLVLLSGILLALFLGPLASRMAISRRRHFFVWFNIVFFNMASVLIEGAYFAPKLASASLPILLGQQLLASVVLASLILPLFTLPAQSPPLRELLRRRPWYSWIWRFLAGSLTYLFLYLLIGAANYNLVTKPYYETHSGGLTVPAPAVVMAVEALRAPLIIFSIILFLFSSQTTRWQSALSAGLLLFWAGGLIPLLLQVDALPLPLLAASGAEIFLQNFSVGVVAALLLQPPRPHEAVSAS